MKRVRAFTLVELLTVIAIISLLSAIIFPVFARVKLNAYKSGDLTAMNSIRTAIQLYRDDQGGYPPALLGYITPYEYRNGALIVPANQIRGPLFPKRIESLETLRSSLNRSSVSQMVPAAWPQADVRALGSAPFRDLNADGLINANDDTSASRQAFSTAYSGAAINYFRNDPELNPNIGQSTATDVNTVGRFYAVSGYDVGPVKYQNGVNGFELRYALFWSALGLTTGGVNDDPRQLGYSEPPEGTVVTWNSYYRDYSNNTLTPGGSKDIVLFLGGSARPVDSRLMSERSWRLDP
jgi:prepilin-type N-terminal cleavage/methylation domain-containing protein